MLRSADTEALQRLGLAYEVQADGSFVNITIADYPLPAGLHPPRTTLLLRLPNGFPDASPDMFWLADPATTTSGRTPAATDVIETYLARSWRRWSRHINTWRPGIDDLDSLLRFVEHCLRAEVEAAA